MLECYFKMLDYCINNDLKFQFKMLTHLFLSYISALHFYQTRACSHRLQTEENYKTEERMNDELFKFL